MHHIPNIISAIRILLIFPIASFLIQESWLNAFILILIAGLSDGVDGFLARTFSWQSKLGAVLDPLADKALMIVLFVILAQKGVISIWLAALVVSRDLIILVGAMAYQLLTRKLEMSPLFMSKLNTALQILFVLVIMYHLAFSAIPLQLLNLLQLIVAVTTIVSGIMYVVIWSGYAKQEHEQNHGQSPKSTQNHKK